MGKTIIVAGYGPGISRAVAERFGAADFSVALVARNAERLNAAVAELRGRGVAAQAFIADLGDADAVRTVVGKIRDNVGPIGALHWNAYSGAAGNLLEATPADIHAALDVATVSLVTAVQASLADLRAAKGSVLVTNGGLGILDPQMDAAAAGGSMGLALANAVKMKLVATLAAKLKPEGIHVAEVVVCALVKGTAWDRGNATLDPALVAEKFWQLHTERRDVSVKIG
jgi:short-subunit dehydrogenase